MTTYIVRRLLQAFFILLGLSIVFFMILHFVPGGPCAGYEGGGPSQQARLNACIIRYGVDKPLLQQYFATMGQYFQGNFGESISNGGQPVISVFAQKLPATILLMGTSYLVQQMIALPLGVVAALKQYTWIDQSFTFISYVFLAMPTFWLGLILIFIFAVYLGWLPAGRVEDINLPVFWSHDWWVMLGHNPGLILGDLAKHLVLPATVLMVTGIAVDSRYMRGSMLEVIRQDYIRTARAKGLSQRAVIFKHAFRNALLPIITNIGLYLPALLGGAVITETIFSWGGVGYLYYNSIEQNDFPVVQAISMIGALAVLIANLLTDLTYAVVDPRIRYD